MRDIVGRDKVTQGDKSNIKIDNRTSGDGWIKGIAIAVIAGVILIIIGALLRSIL